MICRFIYLSGEAAFERFPDGSRVLSCASLQAFRQSPAFRKPDRH
jgi:hypothetical protein